MADVARPDDGLRCDPARLTSLLDAVAAERDPVVRGRVAARLLRDLSAATSRAGEILLAAAADLGAGAHAHTALE